MRSFSEENQKHAAEGLRFYLIVLYHDYAANRH
jgi:hypothetical protein